ncbi:MAG: YfhO family protein [Gemmatimonadaceae bacterium]|nr:YfhO family protein [Gemmatimonadaceae bacterium]
MTKSADSRQDKATTTAPAPHVPPLAGVWATLTCLVAALSLSWPALGGKLLLPMWSDQFKAGFAFRDFARQYWLDHGAIPQWNPYLWGGLPFVDAMHGDTFYPTALLRLLIGTGPGMTWGLVIHLFLAGCFTYAFLRACRLSFFPALVGAVAYQMAGNIAGLVSPGHDGKIFVATLLPLALLLVLRGMRDGKHWAWGPLAIVVGLTVLSPHPQLLQYMLLLTGAFVLFTWRGWASDVDDERPTPRAGLTRLGFAFGAIAVGMLIGAIQFYPVIGYTPWSPRSGGIAGGYEAATSFSLPPEEMLNFALPQFSGILLDYWGRNGIHLHSEYVGVAVLILAACAFGGWGASAHRRLVWFLTGTLVVSLLWALGGNTPFYRLVYALVPGTKFFRAPSTMLYIVAFSFATLAAFGAERLLRGSVRRGVVLGLGGILMCLGLAGASGMLSNSALNRTVPELAERILAAEPALKAGAVRMMLFVVLACAAALLTGTRRLSRDLAGALLVVLVGADLWTVVRQYFVFTPPASELFATDPLIDFLQKQPGPFRVIALPPQRGNYNDIYLDDLRFAGLMAHRIPVVMGYHGNHIGKYDLLIGEAPAYQNRANPNFWRLANVRYFVSDEADLPIEGAKRVLGPVKDLAGNDVFVHEVPGASSYAWVTPVIVRANEAAAARAVLDPRFDVRRAALFDSSANVTGTSLEALPEPLGIQARVTRYLPGSATIELDRAAPAGSALVVSENYYPGWQATVDGKPATTGIADVSLIGVALPEGARKVELTFVNGPYATGRMLTWIAVIVSLVAWAVGTIATRRRASRG